MSPEDPGEEIAERQIDRSAEEPASEVALIVADLEGVDVTELESTYQCIDHVLDHVFSNPPAPEAHVQVAFSYEGFRIRVGQDGTARFIRIGE